MTATDHFIWHDPTAFLPAIPEYSAALQALREEMRKKLCRDDDVEFEVVKRAAVEAFDRIGREPIVELLHSRYGVSTVRQIPRDRWPEFITALKDLPA